MKYRGKQKIDGYHWYYGDLLDARDVTYIVESIDKGEYRSIKVVPETVTKCIDYVDINGVDIYVGDIIKIRKSDIYWSEQDEEVYVVETKQGFLYRLTKRKFNTIEVIGNIWDNPHVLELCKKEIGNDSSRTGKTEEVAS